MDEVIEYLEERIKYYKDDLEFKRKLKDDFIYCDGERLISQDISVIYALEIVLEHIKEMNEDEG